MKLFVAADHNGFRFKEQVLRYLGERGLEFEDVSGEYNPDDDFPVLVRVAMMEVLASNDEDPRAILICASGQGVCMAANRFKGIRAALAWRPEEARASRNDEDSNVLCLPAIYLADKETIWKDVIDTWCKTPFAAAARYVRRNAQLDELL